MDKAERDHELFMLWTLLRQTYMLLQKNQERALMRYDLNMSAYMSLFLMHYATRPVTPTAIASYLSQEIPTITYALDKLEQRGLIERSPSPSNRRGTWLTITEEGVRVLQEANFAVWEPLMEISEVLREDEDLSPLFSLLRRLRNRGAERIGAKEEALDFALEHLRRDPFMFDPNAVELDPLVAEALEVPSAGLADKP